MLIDSHCHLDFPDFQNDRDAVLDRAREAGVAGMLSISTRLDRFEALHALAMAHPGLWCSVGIHPHEAESALVGVGASEENREGALTRHLVHLAERPKVIGLGETGLDFHYRHAPDAVQEWVFRAHIRAARQTGLPVIIHSRDADEATMAILREETAEGPFPGLIHCFSASAELAGTAIDCGLSLSFSGILTFKNAHAVREVALAVPHDRLLVETDAPYLAPVPHRGKRNEPAFTAHTATCLAGLLDMDSRTLASLTTANFFRLFQRASPDELPVTVVA